MKLVVDTHTHTISSGHAYSTVSENAIQAKINGMEAIAMTDHGPGMRGSATEVHFLNLCVIPEYIDGLGSSGAEANITDFPRLDISDKILSRLEFVIAGLHEILTSPGSLEENTEGMINALMNPLWMQSRIRATLHSRSISTGSSELWGMRQADRNQQCLFQGQERIPAKLPGICEEMQKAV